MIRISRMALARPGRERVSKETHTWTSWSGCCASELKVREQGSRAYQGEQTASRESVADERSQSDGQFERIARSLIPCPAAALAGVSCTSSQCPKKMEMRTSNAPPDARLGQWRACPGGEGEGTSVPSALPGQEPFQIALWDSSDSEESRARIQSWYMASARRGQRRATGRES